jgi:putative transcriptional regulator
VVEQFTDFFRIKHSKLVPQPGRVLISEPGLADGNFKRSVILIVEHNATGTIGFVLNRTLDFDLKELLPDFPSFNAAISIGGPVSPNSIQFIHSLGDIIPDTIKIADGLYWGGNFDAIKSLIVMGKVTPRNVKFFVGYSGWGVEQLAKEIDEESWVVSELDLVQIMASHDDLWKKAVTELGSKFKPWTIYPINPSLN